LKTAIHVPEYRLLEAQLTGLAENLVNREALAAAST
jgi:hypothetical protein